MSAPEPSDQIEHVALPGYREALFMFCLILGIYFGVVLVTGQGKVSHHGEKGGYEHVEPKSTEKHGKEGSH